MQHVDERKRKERKTREVLAGSSHGRAPRAAQGSDEGNLRRADPEEGRHAEQADQNGDGRRAPVEPAHAARVDRVLGYVFSNSELERILF